MSTTSFYIYPFKINDVIFINSYLLSAQKSKIKLKISSKDYNLGVVEYKYLA